MNDLVSEEEFRAAMRQLPAQVCIISAGSDGQRTAMTATAVTSLSAEPPQLLACIHHLSRTVSVIRNAGAFAVNLLDRGQIAVANQCARPGLEPEERFLEGNWSGAGDGHPPLLEDAVVNFDCTLANTLREGTHVIFIGRVRKIVLRAGNPLLYHDASYRDIGQRHEFMAREWDSAMHGF